MLNEIVDISIVYLSDLMLAQINDIVASMMVLPNRQVFSLVSDLQIGHLRWSNPQVKMFLFFIDFHRRQFDRHFSGRRASIRYSSTRFNQSRYQFVG